MVYGKYDFPDNCWLGVTVVDPEDEKRMLTLSDNKRNPHNLKFVSIEPCLHPIEADYWLRLMDWIIIGAQTNPFKCMDVSDVDAIVRIAKIYNIPIFMKNSLGAICPYLKQNHPVGDKCDE